MTNVSLAEITRVFARIGVLSFGGPAAQIALLQRETVDHRSWIDSEKFLRGLGYCMLLPGPEAMQLATYIGWHLHGVRGGLIAGGLFVVPGALVIACLSALYITFGTEPAVQQAFIGIKAAVLAIVIVAMARLAARTLQKQEDWIIAITAFLALFAIGLPFPLVILIAALWGITRRTETTVMTGPMPSFRGLKRTLLIWGGLWLAPLIILGFFEQGLLFQLALFFGQLAITTFGGAYAVLAYMTQTVVQDQGWLTTSQMIDALGLAETTPGPLILVTQFVGHLAGHSQGGWSLWIASGLVTLWMTFVPCFLWIFAGAPYLDAITSRPRIARALKSITAAIAGVMASLSLWFAINVLFLRVSQTSIGPLHLPAPDIGSVSATAVICLILSGAALWKLEYSVPLVLALSTVAALLLGSIVI